MLSISDTPIIPIIKIFSNLNISPSFLVPTKTGYEKSIMDCTLNVRKMFTETNFHDYSKQKQGPNHKVIKESLIIFSGFTVKTTCSLYRPKTKLGDPRIWITGLKKYCKPRNLLSLFVSNDMLYIFVMTTETIKALQNPEDPIQETIQSIKKGNKTIYDELLTKIKTIHNDGFIKSVVNGDTGVGMTLENALGISPNSRNTPDYKGIELKCSRVDSKFKQTNRVTLFSKAPDWNKSKTTSQKLLKNWGYWGVDKHNQERFQLHCTLSCTNNNPQGLYLDVDENKELLRTLGKKAPDSSIQQVALWDLNTLRTCLQRKHRETFWIKATSKYINNIEYFSYDLVIHTSNPYINNFQYLLESGKVTLDLLMNFKDDKMTKVRDHGYLFKLNPKDTNLLFPEQNEIKL